MSGTDIMQPVASIMHELLTCLLIHLGSKVFGFYFKPSWFSLKAQHCRTKVFGANRGLSLLHVHFNTES